MPRENARLVAALLDHGASIESVTETETTPSIGGTALYQAAEWGYTTTARILLAHSANPNYVGSGGAPALMQAISRRKADLAGLLLEKGANPNARDSQGYTALAMASEFAHDPEMEDRAARLGDASAKSLIVLLLKYHADPNLKNENGTTALFWVCQSNRPDLIQMLIRAGAKE